MALAWLAGCATGGAGGRRTTFKDTRGASGARLEAGEGIFSFRTKEDAFQELQESAGLEEDDRHEAGEELESKDARALWEALARTKTTLKNFAPRRALFFLLAQWMAQQQEVAYEQVLERTQVMGWLVVMRPDGYLAQALDGEPLQRMGRLEMLAGRWMAGRYEVGAFYWNKGGVFYTVDEALSGPGTMMGELGLERDWLSAALDGAEDAVGEIAEALGQLVTSPVRSAQGLAQLPSAVAALIASSPEYFARYATLPLQEQIREAGRLATHLMLLRGGATGTATRAGTAGARVTVLSVTAEGALALEQMAVPAGARATALGTGAGALYVLSVSGSESGDGAAGKAGGGEFKPFTESNFRENLARLTGKLPEDAHAHHVFPQSLADKFEKAGINIHDPRFGAWWNKSSHLKKSYEYNRKWEDFLAAPPHASRFFSSAEIWQVSMDFKSTTKEFPGFDKIFWIRGSGGRQAFRGRMAVETDDVGLIRAEVHPTSPIEVGRAMGSAEPGEVIWTTHGIPIIIADSVVNLLRTHGFTGWSLYPVAVRNKQGKPVLGYSGLAVTGRCGNIDYSMSVQVPRIFPAGIFPVLKGLLFDPASWDGSDFFMSARRSGHVFVVEEVKKAFERAKIRNVSFEPLDQVESSVLHLQMSEK